jgi:hypothetical protein
VAGDPCTSDGQCCSNYCDTFAGACANGCYPTGTSCVDNSECCSGACSANTLTCF